LSVAPKDGAERSARRWGRWAEVVMSRPARSAVGALVVLAALAVPLSTLHFTGFSAAALPSGLSSVRVETALQDAFADATAAPIELVVAAPGRAGVALGPYARRVAAVPGIAAVAAPRRLGPDLWEIDALPSGAPLSQATLHAFASIEHIHQPYPVYAAGVTADYRSELASDSSRLPWAVAVAALVSLLVVFALTGSVLLPLKSVLASAVSIGAAIGAVVFVFQGGHLARLFGSSPQAGIDSTMPILIGALALGLSTDYGVFLLARVKEAHDQGIPSEAALRSGLSRSGPVLTSAALLFSVAIGALVLSKEVALKELGLGTAAAVVLDASVLRAVLLPSLMTLVGEANWWAPRPLRELHRLLPSERSDGTGRPGDRAPTVKAGRSPAPAPRAVADEPMRP
jgi:RND superfamily putative drug exporter